MGSTFKKTATKPLPASAKIITRKGQRLAEWIDAKGKRRTAPVTQGRDGSPRIVITARTYTGQASAANAGEEDKETKKQVGWIPRL